MWGACHGGHVWGYLPRRPHVGVPATEVTCGVLGRNQGQSTWQQRQHSHSAKTQGHELLGVLIWHHIPAQFQLGDLRQRLRSLCTLTPSLYREGRRASQTERHRQGSGSAYRKPIQRRITSTSRRSPWPWDSKVKASSSLSYCVTLGKCLALPELQALPPQCVGLDHTGVPSTPYLRALPLSPGR